MAGQGSKVLASEYNALQTTVSNILGTGSGTLGYGQTVSSSQVATTSKITATDWTNLINDIAKCVGHQGITLSRAIAAPSVGAKVYYDDSSTACFAAYSSATTAIAVNPQVFPAPGQYSGTVLNNPSITNMAYGTHYHTATLSFGNSNQFRYFFNSGGRLEISPTIAGGGLNGTNTSTNLDLAWQTIFNRLGTMYLYYNSMTITNTSFIGSSVSIASSIGAYQLTTTYQTLATSSTPTGGTYYPNQYQIQAKVDVSPNPTQILIQVIFSDTSLGTGSATWAIKEPVDSTITDTISYTRASGSYVSVVPPTLVTSSFT